MNFIVNGKAIYSFTILYILVEVEGVAPSSKRLKIYHLQVYSHSICSSEAQNVIKKLLLYRKYYLFILPCEQSMQHFDYDTPIPPSKSGGGMAKAIKLKLAQRKEMRKHP